MVGIAKLRAVVLDCPDPVALAEFYAALVGGQVEVFDDGDWVRLRDDVDVRLSFQRASDYRPPDWPNPDKPQQFHIDVTVDDIETAEKQVLALGATKHALQPGVDSGEPWRVYVDPAGHPFCLCWD
jgi:glyoxalase superfamily protein